MANDRELRTALKKTASVLASRELTETEADRLLETFKTTSGTSFERAIQVLTEATRLSRHEIMAKSAASDNTDRTMKDLNDTITNWRPGP